MDGYLSYLSNHQLLFIIIAFGISKRHTQIQYTFIRNARLHTSKQFTNIFIPFFCRFSDPISDFDTLRLYSWVNISNCVRLKRFLFLLSIDGFQAMPMICIMWDDCISYIIDASFNNKYAEFVELLEYCYLISLQ